MNSQEPKQLHLLSDLLADPYFQQQMRAYANRMVTRYQLAPATTGEDLYQQAVERIIRYPIEVKHPLAYVYRVLKNLANSGSRHTRPHHQELPLEEVWREELSDQFDVMQQIEAGILLEEVVANLDSKELEVFNYVLSGSTTARQLGRKLNVSHVTAANRLKALHAKIRRALLS